MTVPERPPTARRRLLLPREHGAYAQLALPLVAVLAGSRPSLAGVLLAMAACAGFVAHEPLLVLLGQRGTRAAREEAASARRWLATALVLALALAATSFVLAPPARPWMALPAALAGVAAVFILRRNERSLAGELVASAALASVAVPTAIASGVKWREAVALWSVFYATSLLATVEVRAIARRRAGPVAPAHETGFARVVAWSTASALLLVLAIGFPGYAVAALPTVGTVVAIAALRPKPKQLRRLGWTLAGASLITTVGAAIALHSSPANAWALTPERQGLSSSEPR